VAVTEKALVRDAQPGMITPAGSIEDALKQFNLYQELKHRLATDDDFQQIAGKKHPKKSFVRKVQRFFNLSCELLRDEPLRDGEGNIIAWVATARAMHLPTGAYQDADGSCSMSEKSPAQRTIHNIRAHAVTRAKNRAILDLVGFGDVSAEEIGEGDDEPRTRPQQRPQPRAQGAKPSAQAQPDGSISDPQRKKLYAVAQSIGLDGETMKQVLLTLYGVQSSKDLTSRQASDLIGQLERIEKGEVGRVAWLERVLIGEDPSLKPDEEGALV
jgi:hypothetical protein